MTFSNIESLKEFDNHQIINSIHDNNNNLRGFISVHRNNSKKPSFGATRYAVYSSETEALRDSLRLSRLMSYKAAMAGLNYGGAKAVIIDNKKNISKKKLQLRSYANILNSLRGMFITGADVGISALEVKYLKKTTPYVVGIKADPVKYTIISILNALKISLQEIFNDENVQHRVFSIEGVGKIGSGILEEIYPKAKKIYFTDINPQTIKKISRQFPKAVFLKPQDFFGQSTDVLMPCALANSINTKNLAKIKTQIICGGANNQLSKSSVGQILHKLGILYIPDYAANCGGLISVVDEYENKKTNFEKISAQIQTVGKKIQHIISVSKQKNIATNLIADKIAEKMFNL